MTIYKIKPRPQQLTALRRSKDKDHFAYFMTMRTGKTKVTFDDAARSYRAGKIDALIVLAPNGVQRQWIEQAAEHFPDDIKYRGAFYSGGATIKEKRRFMNVSADTTIFRILTINIESSSSKSGQDLLYHIIRDSRCMLVVDESSRIKTPGAKRTRFIVRLAAFATMTRILNGTPITQSIIDLYSQFKFLNPHILKHNTFTAFKSRYAVIKREMNYGGQVKLNAYCKQRGIDMASLDIDHLSWSIMNGAGLKQGKDIYSHIVAYKNIEELEKLVAPFTYRLERKDVKDLPVFIPYRLDVEMPSEQRRIYNELEDEACAHLGIRPNDLLEFFLDENKVEASNSLTKLLKAQQVLGGHVKNIVGDLQYIQHNRIKVLLDFLQDVQGKVIIWARFQPEIQEIAAALIRQYGPDSVTEFHGCVSQARREVNKKLFQDRKSACLYLVGQHHAGGVGQTFDAADTIINYSNDFSLYARLQSGERASAFGKKSIAIVDMVVPGTIDEKILAALKMKQKQAEEFNYDDKL